MFAICKNIIIWKWILGTLCYLLEPGFLGNIVVLPLLLQNVTYTKYFFVIHDLFYSLVGVKISVNTFFNRDKLTEVLALLQHVRCNRMEKQQIYKSYLIARLFHKEQKKVKFKYRKCHNKFFKIFMRNQKKVQSEVFVHPVLAIKRKQ